MSNSTPQSIKVANNSFSIRGLSIKSLTLLGFGLVALPLVIALIFGASQVDTLAKKSASAITNITKAMDSQQLLKSSQIKMERSAAQYLVLRDPALAESYREQSQQILSLTEQLITTSQDQKLHQWVIAYTQAVNALIEDTIPAAEKKPPTDSTIIEPIQAKFNALTSIYEQIAQRSNELNTQHITRIKQAAQATRDIMFQSLVIIPISLLIAAIFVF